MFTNRFAADEKQNIIFDENMFFVLMFDAKDFDEKRRDWRKQKKSVINAIGVMTARALRFEDQERKTIALYALDFYKVCVRARLVLLYLTVHFFDSLVLISYLPRLRRSGGP